MSKIFIDRPILATVIALVMVIAGLLAISSLPVALYPDITPPTVTVQAVYPGANAEIIQTTVASPIEEEVNGVDNMIYMSSTSSNDGSYSLTVSFEIGVDLDMSTVLVQNRVSTALNSLPSDVTRLGVTTEKRSTNIIMLISVFAEDPEDETLTDLYLSNFAQLRLKDELGRVPGVSSIFVFGAGEYAMRIWVDPGKLNSLNLTVDEVVMAIQRQNIQVAAGQIGGAPVAPGQSFQYTLTTQGQLKTADEFGDIIIRADGERVLYLKDVARLELGSESYGIQTLINGQPSAMLGVYQVPGANAVQVAGDVRAKVEEISTTFPKGVKAVIILDTSDYIIDSIKEVVSTMVIAIILVVISIFIFLQSFRATLIACIAIPVSIIATFAVMLVIGFSINTFTLFALILAIGIVVDDAILVVENTARILDQGKLNPRDAVVRCMEQITGAVVVTTLVLLAVFIPATMMGGIIGEMFRQFALVICVAVVFSSVNALTLSPAMAALLMRPTDKSKQKLLFFRKFDEYFEKTTNGYVSIVTRLIRKSLVVFILLVAITVLAAVGFLNLPTGFLPTEDQGYSIAETQLPDASSFNRSYDVAAKTSKMFSEMDGIKYVTAIPGFSMLNMGINPSCVAYFFIFDDYSTRKKLKSGVKDINVMMGQIYAGLATIQEARSFAFVPPSIPGLGATGGFTLMLEDRTGVGIQTLTQMAYRLMGVASTQSTFENVYTTYRANIPQYNIQADRAKIQQMGLEFNNVFNSIAILLGGYYVNDFTLYERNYKVYVQAEPRFRASVDEMSQFNIRTPQGDMVPVTSVFNIERSFGPQNITRYNLYPAVTLNGQAASGYSSGQAMAVMEDLADQTIGSDFGYDWTALSFQEKRTSGGTLNILILSALFGFLFLAAKYESWLLAIAVMLCVPLAILGVVIGVVLMGTDINVYTQVGLVLLIGLAAKTAILIVEFGRDLRVKEKYSIKDAAISAARLRFRPVLMTVISFGFGTFPLLIATGASSASRHAIGTAVFFGLLIGTLLMVFMTPSFFGICQWISEHDFFGKEPQNPEDLGGNTPPKGGGQPPRGDSLAPASAEPDSLMDDMLKSDTVDREDTPPVKAPSGADLTAGSARKKDVPNITINRPFK